MNKSLTDSLLICKAPCNLMGEAEENKPEIQDCVQIEWTSHSPAILNAVPDLPELSEANPAARPYKDRNHFDRTGTPCERLEDNQDSGGTQDRAVCRDQVRQEIRVTRGFAGGTSSNSSVPDEYDDCRTVVSSAPSTAPPPYSPKTDS